MVYTDRVKQREYMKELMRKRRQNEKNSANESKPKLIVEPKRTQLNLLMEFKQKLETHGDYMMWIAKNHLVLIEMKKQGLIKIKPTQMRPSPETDFIIKYNKLHQSKREQNLFAFTSWIRNVRALNKDFVACFQLYNSHNECKQLWLEKTNEVMTEIRRSQAIC